MRPSLLLIAPLLLAAAASGARADDFRGSSPLHHRHRGETYRSVRTVRSVRSVHVHSRTTCNYEAGHYETRIRRVVRPGHYVERVVPDRFEIRWDPHCCGYVRVLVSAGGVVRDWVPERIENVRERVWVPGRWLCGAC